MLGWHITVYRQTAGEFAPAEFETTPGFRLAVWQTGLLGLHWIKALVKAGRVIDLGGNGYPYRYTAQVKEITQQILDGPPEAKVTWSREAFDNITEGWVGRTLVETDELKRCDPDEWLLIEVFDES